MKKSIVAVVLLLGIALFSRADTGIEITAYLESGASVLLKTADISSTAVLIGPSTGDFPINDPVVDISGLDELPYLSTVTIVIFPQISTFDFLSGVSGLENLVIAACRVETLAFLGFLSELRSLEMDSCTGLGDSITEAGIDLSTNPDLESLSIVGCGLKTLPILENPPETLRFADFSSNMIRLTASDSGILETYRTIDTLILSGSAIEPGLLTRYPNIRSMF